MIPERAAEAASTSGRPFCRVVDPLAGRRVPGRHVHCAARSEGSLGEVTLLDYGAGNVRSVRNAVRRLGYTLKEVNVDLVSCLYQSPSFKTDLQP